MAKDDQIDIKVKLRGAREAGRDTRGLKREIDELGDEAAQAARKLARMSVATSSARLNIGPLSTSTRGAALGVGALTLATGKLTPALVGAGEAVVHLAGGAGAGAAVGLLALYQGAKVAGLGLDGLGDALGGNEEAAKNLTPEVRDLLFTLQDAQRLMRDTAQEGLLPGVTDGADAALRNLPVVNRVIAATAAVLGDLAREAGDMAGSGAWGRDMGRVGRANARVLDDLGHSALNLADAGRHILVEAGPLAEWMAEGIRSGTQLAETWALNARQSGDMAGFFREARRDLQLLTSAGGHGTRGLLNLFGSQDVDGTQTLRNLDQILARFERWSDSPAVRESLGDAIVAEIPQAVAAAMDAVARNLPAAAGTAGKVFAESFINASPEGKALFALLGIGKLGGFKAAGKALGGGLGFGGRGSSPGSPLWVTVVNQGIPGTGPGSKKPGMLSKARLGLLAGGTAGAAALAQIEANKLLVDSGIVEDVTNLPKSIPGVGGKQPVWEPLMDVAGRLLGDDDAPRQVGRGNPNPLTPPAPFEVRIFQGPINLDGRELARSNARAEKRRRARTGRGG